MSNQAYETKHVRGVLLETLKDYYPNGLAAKTLFKIAVAPLFPGMKWDGVLQQVLYLNERGLIEAIGQSGIGGDRSLEKENYRLTTAGFDVAVGEVEDVTIAIEA